MHERENLNHILRVFESAFGQQLNQVKIYLFFSKNTSMPTISYMMDVSGLKAITNFDELLGLLLLASLGFSTFKGILDKVHQRLGN